jgi:hypothetical protein
MEKPRIVHFAPEPPHHPRHGAADPKHPRVVANLEATEPAEAETDEHPLEQGARDEIDPDLRHRLISEAAFELYRRRGYCDGYDIDDWLQAEAQVDATRLHGNQP